MNIALPTSLEAWVDEQVAKSRCRSPSQFITKVLRKEKQRQLVAEVEKELIEGINSGPATPMTQKDWDAIRKEGQRRIAARQRRK